MCEFLLLLVLIYQLIDGIITTFIYFDHRMFFIFLTMKVKFVRSTMLRMVIEGNTKSDMTKWLKEYYSDIERVSNIFHCLMLFYFVHLPLSFHLSIFSSFSSFHFYFYFLLFYITYTSVVSFIITTHIHRFINLT